ncbi:MAG: selenium cofactor biosynthesis protein YqeC [Clostridia bacterium]|nr:selenium cofactor biosynthesis protein YqeC [Clostridia bacterium]
MERTNTLSALLGIETGCVAFIGAGGKSSLIRAIATDAAGKRKVAVTTSTHIWRPQHGIELDDVTEAELTRALEAGAPVTLGHPEATGKLSAPAIPFETIARAADLVLLEADGSKRLPLKIPNETEPVYPIRPGLVVCVAGLSALGKPFREVCFRAERMENVLNERDPGLVGPSDIATLITHPKGMLWNLPEGVPAIVVLNQADSKETKEAARQIARAIGDPRILRVHTVSLTEDFGGNYAHCCERGR